MKWFNFLNPWDRDNKYALLIGMLYFIVIMALSLPPFFWLVAKWCKFWFQ